MGVAGPVLGMGVLLLAVYATSGLAAGGFGGPAAGAGVTSVVGASPPGVGC